MPLPFRLYLISDRSRMGPDPVAAVLALVRAGLRAFQWREKDLSPVENYEILRRLAEEIGPALPDPGRPPRLFVNDRADLAMALRWNLHLTERSLPTRLVRPLLQPGTLLGRSVHSPESAHLAQEEGADFVTMGPVYDTPSKRLFGPPIGVDTLAVACKALRIPVFALGGLTAERIPECLEAGASGAAVIGAVWGAMDPVQAMLRLSEALRPGPAPRRNAGT